MKIVITADSTFDLPPEISARLDIKVIPSYVSMGGDDLPDYPNVTMRDLFAYHDRSGRLPKTAAASPWDYTEFFKNLLSSDTHILHIAKSSGMSACCDNARMAAESLENIHVFDSLTIAGGSAMVAVRACELRDEGADIESVVESLTAYRDSINGAFIVDNLDYLRKGGRCSALAHLGVNILRLRPQIIIKDGVMTVGKKYRGKYSNCLRELADDLLDNLSSPQTVYVSHTMVDEALLKDVMEYVRAKNNVSDIVALPAGSAVSCHCGPNTFGIFSPKNL